MGTAYEQSKGTSRGNHSQGDKDLVSNLEQVQVVNSKGNSKKDNSLPKNNMI